MSALPAAAACELKDADPAAEPLALTRASLALPKIPVSRYPAASCFSANDFLQPQGAVLKRKDRYDTADLDENQFEPGSRHRVLKNLLGITSKREMDRMEGREQLRVLEELASLYDSDHRFTATDICQMHRLWLGRIYPWAGKYRQMNVKKDSFSFAAAAQISKLDGRIRRRSAQAPYALSLGINGASR